MLLQISILEDMKNNEKVTELISVKSRSKNISLYMVIKIYKHKNNSV